MTSPRPLNSDQQIEQWVREAMLRREAGVVASAIVAKVHASLADMPPAPRMVRRPEGRLRRVAMRLAVAAAVLAAVFGILQFRAGPASAESLIQQSLLEVKQNPVDRCYLIETTWTGPVDLELLLHTPNHSLLWTRGDRFVIETQLPALSGKANEPKWTSRWGRDETGQIWFAIGPYVAYRFEPKEVTSPKGPGEKLRASCELYALNSETLLHDVLAHYDLSRTPAPAQDLDATLEVISATAKPNMTHLTINKARLEFDRKNKMLRRVTLDRKTSTITFTLKEVSPAPKAEEYYQLNTYLSAETRRQLENPEGLNHRIKALLDALKKSR